MRKLLLVFLASCGMTQRPGDLLGPGTMCQPLSQVTQRCTDGKGQAFRCVDSGGRWSCTAE